MQALYTDGTPVKEGDLVRYHQTPGGLMATPSDRDGNVIWHYGIAARYPYSDDERAQWATYVESHDSNFDVDELHCYGKGGWLNGDRMTYGHMAPHIIERVTDGTFVAMALNVIRPGESRR